MTAKQTTYVYWGCTGLIGAMMLFSGAMNFIAGPQVMEMMGYLGYPLYFSRIIGAAKLLGAITLLINRPLRMKEWAYAGFTFDFLGAAISFLSMGDGPDKWAPPLVIFAILMGSYFTWHRRLGTSAQGAQFRRAA